MLLIDIFLIVKKGHDFIPFWGKKVQKFRIRKRAVVVNMNYSRNIDLVFICSDLS